MIKLRGAIVALTLALTLAIPASTLAISQASSETLTVTSTISLTGVPASLAYGSGLGGATLTAPNFSATGITNNVAGAKFTVQATDLSRTGGGGTIASTARRLRVTLAQAPAPPGASVTAPYNAAAPGGAYPGPAGTASQIANVTQATDSAGVVLSVDASVVVPANAVPGAYTGTMTFSFTDNP